MRLNLRLTDEIYEMIKELANKENRSMNSEILYIIKQYYQLKQSKNELDK